MTDILAWVSFVLQVRSMGWPFTGRVRVKRTTTAESEINVGFYYRRRVSTTQHYDTRC